MNQYTDAGLARMMGLPVPTQVHLAVCELLGIYPMTPRARHCPELTILPPTRTEESPQDQPGAGHGAHPARGGGVTPPPTPGFSWPR